MSEEMIMPVFEMFLAVFEIVVLVWLYSAVSDGVRCKHAREKIVLLGIVIFGVIVFCDVNEILPSFKLAAILAVISVGMYFLLGIGVGKLLVVTIYIMIATIVSETAVMGIIMGIHGYETASVFMERGAIRVESVLMSKILYIILLFILKSILTSHKKSYDRKELLILGIQTISSALIIMTTIEISAVTPLNSAVSPFLLSFLAVCCFLAYCLSIWMTDSYFKNQYTIQENIRIEEYQKKRQQYINMRSDAEQSVRQIYHDLTKHIKAIDELRQGRMNELNEYVSDLKSVLRPYERFYDTGCDVLDMILTEKQEIAEEAGILFDARIEPGCLCGFRTFNLNVLFTNALDNAIEANLMMPAENSSGDMDKFISIRIKRQMEGVSILIENTYFVEPVKSGRGLFLTRKQQRELHGIGMSSIKSSVTALGGCMNAENRGGIFSLFILL